MLQDFYWNWLRVSLGIYTFEDLSEDLSDFWTNHLEWGIFWCLHEEIINKCVDISSHLKSGLSHKNWEFYLEKCYMQKNSKFAEVGQLLIKLLTLLDFFN